MKIIGLEEHYRTHAIEKATEKLIPPFLVKLLSLVVLIAMLPTFDYSLIFYKIRIILA